MAFLRRPPPAWILVGAFLASLPALPLADRALHPAPEPPRDCGELADLVRQHRPALHIVLVNENSPEHGVYLCASPPRRDRLLRLLRAREYAGRWNGVVFCERAGEGREMRVQDFGAWGEYALRAGPLLYFGDPRLLADLAPLVGAGL
jgi:hypothetical protein